MLSTDQPEPSTAGWSRSSTRRCQRIDECVSPAATGQQACEPESLPGLSGSSERLAPTRSTNPSIDSLPHPRPHRLQAFPIPTGRIRLHQTEASRLSDIERTWQQTLDSTKTDKDPFWHPPAPALGALPCFGCALLHSSAAPPCPLESSSLGSVAAAHWLLCPACQVLLSSSGGGSIRKAQAKGNNDPTPAHGSPTWTSQVAIACPPHSPHFFSGRSFSPDNYPVVSCSSTSTPGRFTYPRGSHLLNYILLSSFPAQSLLCDPIDNGSRLAQGLLGLHDGL